MSKLYKAQTQQGHSRGFFDYIRSVGEAKSKQEEDALVARDLADLKKSFAAANTDRRLLKEYVVRVFYAEMLGVSAEFAHIHCVNLSSSADLLSKRTGYLGTWLTVRPAHDLMYLVVSNLQRDMRSSSFLDVAAALTAAAKLVRPELMTAINADVVGLMNHEVPLVRKKAVAVMHAFYRKSDGAIGDMKLFRQALCDRDASVMGAALRLFLDVVHADPSSQRDLIPTFLSILKQINEHRLPCEYDYHRIPAPWFQMMILKILAMLIGDDPVLACKCETILMEVITRADNGLNIGYAVTCEAIRVITQIPIIPSLVELAAEAIAKFLSGNNANLRYVGIQALSQIVRVNPKYAREHQHIVMACLEDADEIIRRKTMMLLLAMCNEDNVDTIVTRILKSLSQTTDNYIRQDLTSRICDAVDRYSPGARWYIETMNKVLLCAAEHVPQTVIQGILKLIVEGEEEDGVEDVAFRTFCVETYFYLLEGADKKFPESFCRVAAWVMGEYGFLTQRISRTMLLDRLCDMLERAESPETCEWIVMAMMKIVAHFGVLPDNVEDLITRFKDSRSVGIQQRCYEFTHLVQMPVLMKKVLPLDGCCEEIDVDTSMGFLDNIVQEALLAGARPYEKKTVRLGVKEGEALRTDAYKAAPRAKVADEGEVDVDKFKTDEPHKLLIRPTVRRWGLKNLEENVAAAVEGESKPPAATDDMYPSTVLMERFPDGTVLHHVDPFYSPLPASSSSPQLQREPSNAPREVLKPSKNEKFLNDIFSGGIRKKTTTKRFVVEAAEPTVSIEKSVAPNSGCPALSVHMEYARDSAATGVNIIIFIIVVRITVLRAIERAVVSMKAPPNCALNSLACSASLTTTTTSHGGATVTLTKLQANQLVEMKFQILPFGFPTGGCVHADVTYHGAGSSGHQCVTASIPLEAKYILRPPAHMTTEQFGEIWLTLGEECKLQLTSSAGIAPGSVEQILMERASLRVVEIIRSEIIAAAELLGAGKPLLCHVVIVSSTAANVTVRAEDKKFAEYVARSITSP